MTAPSRKASLRLRLYIAGPGPYATRAEQNLARFAQAAGIEYELELIDLRRDPDRAAVDSVVVTPTLVKVSPKPRAMVVGDLADLQKVAAALGAPLP